MRAVQSCPVQSCQPVCLCPPSSSKAGSDDGDGRLPLLQALRSIHLPSSASSSPAKIPALNSTLDNTKKRRRRRGGVEGEEGRRGRGVGNRGV